MLVCRYFFLFPQHMFWRSETISSCSWLSRNCSLRRDVPFLGWPLTIQIVVGSDLLIDVATLRVLRWEQKTGKHSFTLTFAVVYFSRNERCSINVRFFPCHRLGQELSSEQVSCITASPAVACHLPICCVICSSSSIYLLPNELSQHQNERFCCLLRRACPEFQFLDYYCLATSLFQAVSASPDRAFVCGSSLVEKLYAFPVIKFNQPLPSFFF